MVVYSIAVLSFGSRFFNIKAGSIRTYKIIRGYQAIAAYLSFACLAITGVLLLLVSVLNVRRIAEGKYFLAAVSCGMPGLVTTDLAVMGFVPFTRVTFHAVELGIVLEASIFAMALTRQIRKREVARIKSERLASYDPLTNLYNRSSFYKIISPLMESVKNNSQSLGIIMIDVDKLKSINDTYGHRAGDETLKIISQRIRARLRSSDIAVRWGGEDITFSAGYVH